MLYTLTSTPNWPERAAAALLKVPFARGTSVSLAFSGRLMKSEKTGGRMVVVVGVVGAVVGAEGSKQVGRSKGVRRT